MRRSAGIAIAIAILGGSAAGAAAAHAAAAPPTDSQLVKPAISNASGQFFTSAQIPAVWSAVTANYPAALPEGVTFPNRPTSFFTPDSTDAHTVLYQVGLVDEVVANYWECSWLKVGIQAEADNDTGSLNLADAATAAYGSLPSIAANLDMASYREAVVNYAKTLGVSDLRQAEYGLECGA